MWKEVERYRVPTQIVNLIKETYRGYVCRVVHEGRISQPICGQTGVRQGCILSSVWGALSHLAYLTITCQLVKLFIAALKKAAKNCVESRYMKCGIFGNVTSWRLV